MNLAKLPKTTTKSKKRVGRGYGSGKGGHTVGRGAKGFKARNKAPLTFMGTKTKKSLIKKLPLQRGKGKFKPLRPDPVVINLKYLDLFSKGKTVNLKSLVEKGLVKEKEALSLGVKILGGGGIKTALKVDLPCSKSAIKAIEKVGGQVVWEPKKAPKGKKTKLETGKAKKRTKAKTRAKSKTGIKAKVKVGAKSKAGIKVKAKTKVKVKAKAKDKVKARTKAKIGIKGKTGKKGSQAV